MSTGSPHKHRKNIRFYLIILLIVFLVCSLLLHPIISTIFIGVTEHHDIELYTSGEYLQFKKGTLFQEAIDSLDFIDLCTITDFYYYDSWPLDNWFYGKACDIFCLDLQAGTDYDEIKERIHASSKKTLPEGNYEICQLSENSSSKLFPSYNEYLFVATNDQTSQIRCLLIADCKSLDDDFRMYFTHFTYLEW